MTTYISYKVNLRSGSTGGGGTSGGNTNLYVVSNNSSRDSLDAQLNDVALVLKGADNALNINILSPTGWVAYPIEGLQNSINTINQSITEINNILAGLLGVYKVNFVADLVLIPNAEKVQNRLYYVKDFLNNGTNKGALYIYNEGTFVFLTSGYDHELIQTILVTKQDKIDQSLFDYDGITNKNIVSLLNQIIVNMGNMGTPPLPEFSKFKVFTTELDQTVFDVEFNLPPVPFVIAEGGFLTSGWTKTGERRIEFTNPLDAGTELIIIGNLIQNVVLEESKAETIAVVRTAGEDLSGHRVVILENNQVKYFDPNNEAHYDLVFGVTNQAAISGDPIEVILSGRIQNGSFASGVVYFAGLNGAIQSDEPTFSILQEVGLGINSSEMLVRMRQPILI